MWKPFNPNPCGLYVGDCVIRALSIIFGKTWERIYLDLCILGYCECDMPSANHVWGKYLEEHGFVCHTLPMTDNVTIRQYAEQHPQGQYLLATGAHVVAVINGEYYDAWDSGNEHPIYVWEEH